jgi:hypothetical protein
MANFMKTGKRQKNGKTVVKKEDSDFSPLSVAKQRERERGGGDDDDKGERSE